MARRNAGRALFLLKVVIAVSCSGGMGHRAWAQGGYPTYAPPSQMAQPANGGPNVPPGRPDQPVDPQLPRLERRTVQAPYDWRQNTVGPYSTPSGTPYGSGAAGGAQSANTPHGTTVPSGSDRYNASGQPLGRPAAATTPQPITQVPPSPFELTAEQAADVERVLRLWEQRSAGVKTFECRFKRWEYDRVFGPKDAPRYEDLGVIKYAAPDRGVFQVTDTVVYDPQDVERRNPRQQPIEPERAEHWICDGKSVYEYVPQQKTVNEYPLPPELQGKAIANSPLPFLFGSRAEDLKRRYFLRIITPVELQNQQTWIEAYPRYQADAANFSRAILVLQNHNMQPFGMKVFATNGKNETSYQFFEIVVNDPLRFFKGDPFRATVPIGWKTVVHRSNTEQAGRPSPPGAR